MLLGIAGEEKTKADAPTPLETAASEDCVGDPEHDCRGVRRRRPPPQMNLQPESSAHAFPRGRDDRLCVGAVAEAARLRLPFLEILVDLEEVLDLVPQLRRDVVDVRDAAPRRI